MKGSQVQSIALTLGIAPIPMRMKHLLASKRSLNADLTRIVRSNYPERTEIKIFIL